MFIKLAPVTPRLLLDQIIEIALSEDLAGGDLSGQCTIPEDAYATATAVAKKPLVLSGGEVFSRCFHSVDAACRVERLAQEGAAVPAGGELFRIEGPARSLLAAERTALNFLQRLSGTATLTRAYVDAAGGRVRITDTRKTTPGLRALERQAVRAGGGYNHRNDLGSAVMIKDNHIAASGGIPAAVGRARALAPHTCRVEVEVTDMAQLREALDAGADIVMLDNFLAEELPEAIALARGRAITEISGNVTLERIPALSRTGVDVISVGALTHSAVAADISLRLALLAPVD